MHLSTRRLAGCSTAHCRADWTDLGSPNAPSDGAAGEAQLPFEVDQAFQTHVTTGVVTPGAMVTPDLKTLGAILSP